MPSPVRMKKTTPRLRQGRPLFVVQIAVPDGGFRCTLDAVNAWHHYNNNAQRRGRPQRLGEREFWTWCFEGLEIAKSFRHRFGGEIVPVTIQRVPERRHDPASQFPTAVKSECNGSEQKSGAKHTSSSQS
jgi:hypothetical protein